MVHRTLKLHRFIQPSRAVGPEPCGAGSPSTAFHRHSNYFPGQGPSPSDLILCHIFKTNMRLFVRPMPVPCTKIAAPVPSTSSRAASLPTLAVPDRKGRKRAGLAGRLWTPPEELDPWHVPVSLGDPEISVICPHTTETTWARHLPSSELFWVRMDRRMVRAAFLPIVHSEWPRSEDTMRGTDSQSYKTTGSTKKLLEQEDTKRRTP